MRPITGRTKLVGVWGHPVGHSRSPVMHNAALDALGLDWAYVPFDIAPSAVPEAVAGLRALGLVGVNVTVPLKEIVPGFLDTVDDDARRIGSVNTLHNRDGRLHGYSTDGAGFLRSLEAAGQSADGREVLLLGAGGSARAVAFALAARGSRCRILNRTAERAQALAHAVNSHYPGAATVVSGDTPCGALDLLVNTTSLGMHPNEDAAPALPPEAFAAKPFVYDLIYVPAQTRLLAQAEAAGCAAMNGVTMLVWQGALSLALWTGLPVAEMPVAVMEQAVRASLEKPVS